MGGIISCCMGTTDDYNLTNEIDLIHKRYNYIDCRLSNLENLICDNTNIKAYSNKCITNISTELKDIKNKISKLDQKLHLYDSNYTIKFNSIDKKLQGISNNTILLVNKSNPIDIPSSNHLLTM
jgi:hypothetical protein